MQDTIEENVLRLSRERATAMDMSAAVPHAKAGGAGGGADTSQLTVKDVAALVCSRWRDGSQV